ncbi:MAG: TIGR03067 domain-containing protein [Pedosphaera sp.]|nr:TIGR03067 domain-containing protein [Pedosphaera sp.]
MKMPLKESLGLTVLSLLMPCLLLGLQLGCATHPPTASGLHRLQGTWEGGVVGDKSHDKITITIAGDSFHFHRDTNFWFETTIALPAGTNPQQLRATIQHSAPPETSNGKVVVAIFKIEDGTLTLATRGDGGEETPTSFEATEDKGLTRYELRKVQLQKKNTQPPKIK